ncbi:MAG: hypothetical protein U1F57_07895 [bacterium]
MKRSCDYRLKLLPFACLLLFASACSSPKPPPTPESAPAAPPTVTPYVSPESNPTLKNPVEAPNAGNLPPALPTAPPSAGESAPEKAPPSNPAMERIIKAIQAQMGAKSYRADMTGSTSNGTQSHRTIEYLAPDRYRITSEVTLNGRPPLKQEIIILGNQSFMKKDNGPWQPVPMDMGTMVKELKNPKMLDELRKSSDAKEIGAESVNGTPLIAYQYSLQKAFGMDLNSSNKIWISPSDGLVRKLESHGDFAGVKTNTTIIYSDYNGDIKIEKP